jgi:hypothetical protein
MENKNAIPKEETTGDPGSDMSLNVSSSKTRRDHKSDSLFGSSNKPVKRVHCPAHSSSQGSFDFRSLVRSRFPRPDAFIEDSELLDFKDIIEKTSSYIAAALEVCLKIATPDEYPELMRSTALACKGLSQLIKTQNRLERSRLLNRSDWKVK